MPRKRIGGLIQWSNPVSDESSRVAAALLVALVAQLVVGGYSATLRKVIDERANGTIPAAQIVDVHFPNIKKRLVSEALNLFFEIREVPGLKKKPSTSELLDCLKLLLNEDVSPETLRERDTRKVIPPLHGALLKNEQDVMLFERLAFMARREAR